jgi:hypothetical protein
MQKRHIQYAQAKGSDGGITLPYMVAKEAINRYFFDGLSTTQFQNVPVANTAALVEISAIGGGVFVAFKEDVEKGTTTNADAVLTSTGAIANEDTVTIGDVTYTFVTSLSTEPTVPYEVLLGENAAAALDNLKSAINGTAGEGTTYSTGTEAHPDVIATTNTDTAQTVVAQIAGPNGNDIEVSAEGDNIDWDDETLTSGQATGNWDAYIPGGATMEVGTSDDLTVVSIIAEDGSTDVAVVEY